MIPAEFDYHAPTTVADAMRLLGELGPDARPLAGGHSLLPMMKLRFAQPAHLVDLNRIDAMAMQIHHMYTGGHSAEEDWAGCGYWGRLSSRAAAD